jgi:hypothetical protein
MKKLFLVSSLILTFFLSGCMQTRYITEQYIKTKIETHKEGEFSTIKTYSVFQGTALDGKSYLELTGYKYNTTKALVLGADKYYLARQKFKGDQTVDAEITYIELTADQCADILYNYSILQDKIRTENPRISEEIYHDYTVSKDLFISYRKSAGSMSVSDIDLWIDGEKYSIATGTIMKKLSKFMSY